MGQPKEESFVLNSADTTAIPSGNRTDTSASVMGDIWKYQVPSGQAHILKAGHRFSAYISDTAPAEAGAGTCRVQIEIRDQSQKEKEIIFGPVLYATVKEFQQDDKMARLDIQRDYVVEEKFFIVVMGIDDTGIDESNSYFKLETIRVRKGL